MESMGLRAAVQGRMQSFDIIGLYLGERHASNQGFGGGGNCIILHLPLDT